MHRFPTCTCTCGGFSSLQGERIEKKIERVLLRLGSGPDRTGPSELVGGEKKRA